MPWPPTASDLQNEYVKNGVKDSGVNDDLLLKMKEIALALTNKGFMIKIALRALNDSMLKLYRDRVGNTVKTEDLKKAMNKARADRPENDPSRHLLTEVLTDFESKNGFKTFASVNGHPRIVQMTGLVSGPGFLSTVGAGHMAKDYVTLAHGVYTHRIQWYCLHCLRENTKINLPGDFGKLYQDFTSGMAWLITFDRLPEHEKKATDSGNIDTFDFRTPEKLHGYLKTTDASADVPLLAAYMQDKAEAIKNITNWVLVKRVTAARKMFPAKAPMLEGWKKLSNVELEKKLKEVLSQEELQQLAEVVVMKPANDKANLLTPDGKAYKAGGPA